MTELNKTMATGRYDELVGLAIDARSHAYAPYSKYRVGAAVLTDSGRVFTGCNVENASYGLCICAERTAIVKAVSELETSLTAIAVATDGGGTPCGACRQFMAEFSSSKTIVITHDTAIGTDTHYLLGELLPHAFQLHH